MTQQNNAFGMTASDVVARQIQNLRQRRNWSYSRLANRSGISFDVLINLIARTDLKHHRDITIDEMVKLAKALDVSVIQLLPQVVSPDAMSVELPFENQNDLENFLWQIQRLADRLRMFSRSFWFSNGSS